jgi:hypothetical protein
MIFRAVVRVGLGQEFPGGAFDCRTPKHSRRGYANETGELGVIQVIAESARIGSDVGLCPGEHTAAGFVIRFRLELCGDEYNAGKRTEG